MAYVIGDNCVACGTCIDECTESGTCASVCPNEAISLPE